MQSKESPLFSCRALSSSTVSIKARTLFLLIRNAAFKIMSSTFSVTSLGNNPLMRARALSPLSRSKLAWPNSLIFAFSN